MSSIDQLFGTKRINDQSKYTIIDPLDNEINNTKNGNQTFYHFYVPKNKNDSVYKILIAISLALGGLMLWQGYSMWKKIKKLERIIQNREKFDINYNSKGEIIFEENNNGIEKYENDSFFNSVYENEEQ